MIAPTNHPTTTPNLCGRLLLVERRLGRAHHAAEGLVLGGRLLQLRVECGDLRGVFGAQCFDGGCVLQMSIVEGACVCGLQLCKRCGMVRRGDNTESRIKN